MTRIKRKILQYDQDGNFMREWNSLTDIVSSLNLKTVIFLLSL